MEYLYILLQLVIVGCLIYYKEAIRNLARLEVDKVLEEYKYALVNRQKAEKVAELFALYLAGNPDLEKANRLLWELSFYLPRDLVREMSNTIIDTEKKKGWMELFIKIRRHILGKDDGLTANDIIHFVKS